MGMNRKVKLKKANMGGGEVVNKENAKSCCKQFFIHFGLFIIVVLYTVGGAYILISSEGPVEEKRFQEKRRAALDLIDAKIYLCDMAWYEMTHGNWSAAAYEFETRKKLLTYSNYVVKLATDKNYDGYPDSWNYDWTITKSILFTITTIGSIGYGHISPKTIAMRIFCIYYGMIGIPLLLLFLAGIGDLMAKVTQYIYSRLCCRWCRVRRKVSEGLDRVAPGFLSSEKVGMEPYMPTDLVDVPIMVNLLIIFVYLVLGGALFSFWENWELHEAAYFTFITLTTIGFGDYVPGNSFSVKHNDALSSAMKMLVTILFSLFGMALLSMAINLMKEQIVDKCRWMVRELGIVEDDVDVRVKYKIKRCDERDMIKTNPGHGGIDMESIMLNFNDANDCQPLLQRSPPPPYRPN